MKKLDLNWPSVGHLLEQTAREFKDKDDLHLDSYDAVDKLWR